MTDAIMTGTTEVVVEDADEGKKKKPTTKVVFEPQSDWTLLSQGAEARIWKIPATCVTVANATTTDDTTPTTTPPPTPVVKIAKERFSKSYRHPILDEKLTKSRCKAEGRILEKCRNNSNCKIDVPEVIRIEQPILYLEYIDGITVREYLEEYVLCDMNENNNNNNNNNENPTKEEEEETTSSGGVVILTKLAIQIGTIIGNLHSIGCIHGDLTTSNMMLRGKGGGEEEEEGPKHHNKKVKPNEEADTATTATAGTPNNSNNITLIDFGLAKNTTSAEERAVDLYVLERALTSTHPKLPEFFFQKLLESYQKQFALAVASGEATSSADNNNNNNKNKNNKKATAAADSTLQRLEQVRLRGRKRECFG